MLQVCPVFARGEDVFGGCGDVIGGYRVDVDAGGGQDSRAECSMRGRPIPDRGRLSGDVAGGVTRLLQAQRGLAHCPALANGAAGATGQEASEGEGYAGAGAGGFARACVASSYRGEQRWPGALAVVVVIGLQSTLPEPILPQEHYELLGLEVALLVSLVVANPCG